jgi:murein DD-endopeptidase MepM/ murein hydrolase activator NlpD
LLLSIAILLITGLGLVGVHWFIATETPKRVAVKSPFRSIHDTVLKGETLLAIFEKYGLDAQELFAMRDVAAKIHPLKSLQVGQPYTLTVDCQSRVNSFVYWINRDSYLSIQKVATGFQAEKNELAYEKKLLTLSGAIEDNLISAIGEDREHLVLALDLSDVFAWDIDFASDLRKGDTYRIIAEGYFYNGQFRKYGNIVAAEFTNNGELFKAYRFDNNGKAEYYDENGNSRRKAFLKAPLVFRKISSYFARSRFHPVLKIRRAHQGIDYAAATGTPVSTVGDGKVVQAGWSGGYGKLVVIRHPNGWLTRYGHLSRISKGIAKGKSVSQGQTIGAVGSTGLSTGPHLHYEVRAGGRSVNPLALKMPKGWPVPKKQVAAFRAVRDRMEGYFTAMGSCDVPARPAQRIIKTGYTPSGKSGIIPSHPSRSASTL